jgi:3-hydroxyisobutyrate dehydrogenase
MSSGAQRMQVSVLVVAEDSSRSNAKGKHVRIGFIGLGQMGRGMAANLQSAGHDLVITELAREAAASHLENGAQWVDTPREVALVCDVVFTSLPTPADVLATAKGKDGLEAGLREGSAWFDLSTNSVEVVRKLHGELGERGVHFFDAPVSGGPAGAASGQLAIWVGGDEAVFETHRELLDAMSDSPRYVGEIGAGTIAKLVHNMASTAIGAVMAEVLTVGVKAGLEPVPLWEAIRTGAAGRMRSFDNVKRFLQGTLDPPSSQLRLLQKDVGLALQLGRDVSVPMRLCDLVHDEITEAMNRGWGGRDSQSFLVLQQERAGVPPFEVNPDELNAAIERSGG